MGRGRYLVEAVVLEGRSPRELARAHGVSKSWIYELVARYRAGGHAAIEPRSKRPRSCAHATAPAVQRAVLKLRRTLIAQGHDGGPQTIAHHLARKLDQVPSITTIWRILKRAGLVTPQPQKRPRSSFIRFEAQLPNELWQGDTTHWTLAGGTSCEIFDLVDDHSRLALAAVAFPTVKAADVMATFFEAAGRYGLPTAVLTDNAAVFSGSSRGGTVVWESELERLGIRAVHSTPYHPQTCGKVERFHQTLKRYLAKRPRAASIAELQAQLDTFRSYYDQRRPHRALSGRTPLAAFHARIKARPAEGGAITRFRVRHDRVDVSGRVTLRHRSILRHIYIGRAHSRAPIRLLIAGDQVRIIKEDGSLLRELKLDADSRYFGLRTPVQNVLRQASGMS
ncbi:MAG TPA: IS481 family transposase [archaeon]|nr:IS481 family transposase [archaeon]